MAYAQWVYMVIQNLLKSGDLSVKNLHAKWQAGILGKFYEWDNKDKEISASDVEQQEAGHDGGEMGIASCGRSDSASGTEGSYDIYDRETKVCNVYWDCPWGKKTNTFVISEQNENYVIQATGQNLDSGALGTVTIRVVKVN